MSRPESLLWDRWPEVDRLLSEALDLPPEAREEHVRRGTGGDAAMRDLALRLVARLGTENSNVTGPSESLVAAAFASGGDDLDQELAAGSEVGRYLVVGRRARGGMATVYEAERNDGTYRQRVALKVLRRGLDTEDLIRRFRTERQILSSLTHPNIASLLDGGSTADGRPYLVMELVDGRPITAHADEHRLGVRARLGLFLAVADGVHAAHKQLVVHRDIKPSNILVDGDGRVKLLDFGIAKLLAEDSEHTAAGGRALTPDYASPEQLRGGPITTGTDVYQLGLLLRELLTGVRPGAAGTDDPPTRLSRLVTRNDGAIADPVARADVRSSSPGRLVRELAGDLDLIAGKALRHDPEARYASADELAADVRLHLRGQPVLAHPESAGYRIRKFVQRHRVGVASIVGAMVLLLGYALTVTMQSRQIRAERDRAEQEAKKAKAVTEFMVQLFNGADPNQTGGEDISVRELLDVGARQMLGDDNMEPAVRAALLAAIGRSYYQLGRMSEAGDILNRALAVRRGAFGGTSLEVAEDLHKLAMVLAGSDQDSALALFGEALARAEAAGGPEHPLVGRILIDYAVTRSVSGSPDEVRGMLARAVAILRKAPAEHREALAHALTVSAYGLEQAVAVLLMRESLEIRRELHGDRHSSVAGSLSDLALALEVTDPLAADSLLELSMQTVIAIHGERHFTSLRIMNNLAGIRRDRGAYAKAVPLYRRVLELRRELYPERRVEHAYTLYGLGISLVETGSPIEGESRLREALVILSEERPESAHPDLTRAAIGHALGVQGRFAAAERMLVQANEALQQQTVHPMPRARALEMLVRLYQIWGRPDRARPYQAKLDSLSQAGGA